MTSLRRAVLLCSILTILPRFAAGQCTVGSGIKNFRGTTNTTSYTINWDAPAGAPVEAVYEVMQATGVDYCAFPNTTAAAYSVIATTSATTYTAQKDTPGVAYFVFVRLQSDHCVATEFTLVTDTFTTPPAKPVILRADVSASTVTVTFNHNDPHVDFIQLYRAASGGMFTFVDEVLNPCNGSTATAVDTGVAAGTYQYELVAFNDGNATGLNGVDSAPVTVVVGVPTLQIVSFAATPPTVRAGQPVTLSWVTQGASSIIIDQGVGGGQPAAGTATVTPSGTTTYTLTAMTGASTVTATVTVNVLTAPLVAISAFPSALLQIAGSGGATTHYTLTNAGGTQTTINLSQNQNFFTQSPPSFTLAPGASQAVTVTGVPEPAGPFQGASIPSGNGVASGLQVPIKLLSAQPPSGPVTADPSTNRVDVVTSTGTVDFTNSKDGTVTGILVSDAPWLIPPPGVITIPPHSTVTVTFTIDRSQRPDSAALIGSVTGNLSLVYLGNGLAKIGRNDTTTPSVSLVTVVDTVQLTVSAGSPPPLAAGEVALFIPGMAHAPGSVGLFISDLSVLNPLGRTINDLHFYYTSRGKTTASSKSASVPNVAANVSVALADVVKNVFGNDGDVGSLQIRSSLADKLGVNANVFVTSDPGGTFGTSIPTFRSDRAVGAGDRLFLTGVRSEPTLFHTNLYLQETSGVQTTVQAEYLAADGSSLGTSPYTLDPFSMLQIGGMPAGAVSAIVTNTSTGSGKFLAYATPVDELSKDNWSIVDWSRQYGYSPGEPVVIPIAAKSQGVTGYFKTDATIMNTGSTQASGTLRYVANGVGVDRQVTLGGRQTAVFKDLTATLFGIQTATLGYLVFTPVTGTFAVTSRTYATKTPDSLPTFGSATPTIALAQALKAGSLRQIGSLEDAATIPGIVRPATFRTNFGLAEVTGNDVVVRVTLRFTYPAGAKVQGVGTASKDYAVPANGFVFVNGMASDILGAANRATLGDLHGMEADFQVISGTGAVTLFTSSVDNGTSDAINRTE